MARRVKLRVVPGEDTNRVARRGTRCVRNGIETSCCSHGHLGWSAKLDLSGSESLDNYHGAAALGTEAMGVQVLGRGPRKSSQDRDSNSRCNPSVKLPNLIIVTAVRQDASRTTFAFSSKVQKVSDESDQKQVAHYFYYTRGVPNFS